jgi:DNA mismatch repair protein MutS2
MRIESRSGFAIRNPQSGIRNMEIRADLELLEFPELLRVLERYAQTPEGRKRMRELRPHSDRMRLEAQLERAREAAEYLRALGTPGKSAGLLRLDFSGIADLEPVLPKLRVEGAELEPVEISAVLALIDRAADFKHILGSLRERFPALAEAAQAVGEFRPLLRELTGKILPDGSLDDHASLELWRLRRAIEKHRKAIQDSLESFLKQHAAEGTLQEELITIRNERFVVPVKAGARRRIDGVVHGVSGSGQTLFIEPMQTIELNNELVALLEQEAQEVHRILREMTTLLSGHAGGIGAAFETITDLDLAFAKGRFAMEFDAIAPRFNDERRLRLREARHPLLEDVLRRRNASVVPLSADFDGQHRVMVISGPNTGGKTVALKTVGLLVLAAQAAIPVPAAEADLPLFEQVLADIGDYQSIEQNLSTFSAHLTNIERMAEQVGHSLQVVQTEGGRERAASSEAPGERTLVLLDELGAATDPQEGGALAVGVVDYFLKTGATVLASTHHLALKAYATNTPGVLNASVGFDEKTLQPTYKLIVGVPGKSSGLAIAQRLGLKREILERARQALSAQDEEVSRLLAQLHQTTEEAERLRGEAARREGELRERTAQLAAEWEKREKSRLAEMEKRIQSLLVDLERRGRAEIQQIQDKRLLKEAERRVARAKRELREQYDTAVLEQLGGGAEEEAAPAEAAPDVHSLREGDMVRVKALGREGIVRRRLDFSTLEVEVGAMKMKVSLEQVEPLPPAARAAVSLPANVTVHTETRLDASFSEINVIGCRAEEARARVDKFLDSAVLAVVPRVRVVHGHGMGVLRKTLHEFFGTHPLVEKFYAAPQQEGGTGATIVELRV